MTLSSTLQNTKDLPPPLQSELAWRYFDMLNTMIVAVDHVGHCLNANTAFESHVGLSRKILAGSSILDRLTETVSIQNALYAINQNEYASISLDAVLLLGQTPSQVMRDEGIPVRLTISKYEPDGYYIVELVESQEPSHIEREKWKVDPAQVSKELTRNLAHEIKNPLGGIRGSAQLLAMEIDDRSDLTEYTDVIIKEADRLQVLVDRLLAPHQHMHHVGDVNIHKVCEYVRRLVSAEFPKGLKIQRDYDASLPDFRGDMEQLIQAVLNIVRNAAQALKHRITQADAHILLRTRVVRQCTIRQQRHRLALELLVEDNGPGIPDEIKERIFFPLVSGRDGGSGLGLHLAQTFIQQHEGSIEFQSREGKTRFLILIPLY